MSLVSPFFGTRCTLRYAHKSSGRKRRLVFLDTCSRVDWSEFTYRAAREASSPALLLLQQLKNTWYVRCLWSTTLQTSDAGSWHAAKMLVGMQSLYARHLVTACECHNVSIHKERDVVGTFLSVGLSVRHTQMHCSTMRIDVFSDLKKRVLMFFFN